MDKSALKNKLLNLFAQFEKQDNPIVLREISITAYRLMLQEKENIICCPECKEIGLISTFHLPSNEHMQIFNNTSKMRCENGHQWEHRWVIGDEVVIYEPIDQFYLYRCKLIKSSFHVDFVRVNGKPHFIDKKWNSNILEYVS